jgi:hypothetical protein
VPARVTATRQRSSFAPVLSRPVERNRRSDTVMSVRSGALGRAPTWVVVRGGSEGDSLETPSPTSPAPEQLLHHVCGEVHDDRRKDAV